MDEILVKRTLMETTETENYLSSDNNNPKLSFARKILRKTTLVAHGGYPRIICPICAPVVRRVRAG